MYEILVNGFLALDGDIVFKSSDGRNSHAVFDFRRFEQYTFIFFSLQIYVSTFAVWLHFKV